jgi:translation elongation factor EF-4
LLLNWKNHSCLGKTGLGVENIWLLLSKEFRPKGNVDEPLQALIFDLHNPFRGIEVIFRVINGEIKKAKRLSLWLLVMNISTLNFKTKSSTEKVISTMLVT